MALPIIIFFILVAIALIMCWLGAKANTMWGTGTTLSLGGVLFIIIGLFLFSSGIQLDTVSNINVDTGEITYQTLTTETDTATNALANMFLWGGFIPIMLGIAYPIITFVKIKNAKKNEYAI